MNPLISVLQAAGYHTLRITLAGHQENLATGRSVHDNNARLQPTFEIWKSELLKAIADIEQKYPELPRYNLSYSLGSLITTTVVDDNEDTFRRMVFLAPALSLKPFHRFFLNLALPFRHFGWSLPSQNVDSYIIHDGVAIETYNELLEGIAEAEDLDNSKRLNGVPTILFLSEDDEVLNNDGIHDWVSKRNLESWEIITLEARPNVKTARDHLILDETMLGKKAWEKMTSSILSHFACEKTDAAKISNNID